MALPYGIGPYVAAAVLAIGYSAVDRLLDFIAGKEKKSGPAEPLPILRPLSQMPGIFHAELLPKLELCLGDIVTFKVTFKGVMKHGLLQAEIKLPDGTKKSVTNFDTIDRHPNWFTVPKLKGPINDQFEWKWEIPETGKTGLYIFLIRAYERIPYTRKVAFKLHVLLWLKSHGISSIDTEVLDKPIWVPIHQQEYEAIVKE